MKRIAILGLMSVAAAAGLLGWGSNAGAQGGGDSAPNSYDRLQSATPGTQQIGNANISGALIAGQLQGGGNGLTNVNADLLDGLDSTAFLQSVPVPLNLAGSNATYILRAMNSSTANGSSGLSGIVTGTTGASWGVFAENSSTGGIGVYGYEPAATGNTF